MPPPPPPAPPPPPFGEATKIAGGDAKGVNMLLADIRNGKPLKKAVTNDRSQPVVGGIKPKSSPTSTENNVRGGGGGHVMNGGPPSLGGLFAGGMPKLKPTGRGIPTISSELPTPSKFSSIRSTEFHSFNNTPSPNGLSQYSPSQQEISPRPGSGGSSGRSYNNNRGPPPQPPGQRTNLGNTTPETTPTGSPLSSYRKFAPPLPNKPQPNFGKQQAPRPPLASNKPYLPPKINLPSPSSDSSDLSPSPRSGVNRAQSMRMMRPLPPSSDLKPINFKSQDDLNMNGMPRGLKAPPPPPPNPPPTHRIAPAPPSQNNKPRGSPTIRPPPSKAPQHPPPPPPSLPPSNAPPPPPHRTGPAPPPPRTNGLSLGVGIPQPPMRHSSMRNAASSSSLNSSGLSSSSSNSSLGDFESRFSLRFHRMEDLPKPEQFVGLPKTYPSKTGKSLRNPGDRTSFN